MIYKYETCQYLGELVITRQGIDLHCNFPGRVLPSDSEKVKTLISGREIKACLADFPGVRCNGCRLVTRTVRVITNTGTFNY